MQCWGCLQDQGWEPLCYTIAVSYSAFPLQRQICAQCRWQRYNATAVGRVKFRAEHTSMFTPCLRFDFFFSQRLVVTRRFLLDICIKSRNAQTFWCSRPLSTLSLCRFQSHNAPHKRLSSTSIGMNWKRTLRCTCYVPVETHH